MWSAAAAFAVLALSVGANPYLEEGRRLHAALEYRAAAERLEIARTVPSSTPAEHAEALMLLGTAYVALGETADADRVFAELVTLDPHADLSGPASPKLKSALARARERVYPPDFVRVDRLPAPEGTVRVAVIDPWRHVADLRVRYRDERGDAQTLAMSIEGNAARANLPDVGVAAEVPFWIEAVRSDGAVVAQVGSAEAPLLWKRFSPAARLVPGSGDASPQMNARPRVATWVLLGTAFVTAAAATGFGVSAANDARLARDAEFGSQTQAFNARARQKAVTANVLGGAALVAGGTAGILWWAW